MKKILILASLLFVLTASAAFAQRATRVDERQQAQRTRIREGVTSGEVTRPEAARLRSEQRHIRRVERRAKSDGTVTRREKANISRKQNKASRVIRKEKTDKQKVDE